MVKIRTSDDSARLLNLRRLAQVLICGGRSSLLVFSLIIFFKYLKAEPGDVPKAADMDAPCFSKCLMISAMGTGVLRAIRALNTAAVPQPEWEKDFEPYNRPVSLDWSSRKTFSFTEEMRLFTA